MSTAPPPDTTRLEVQDILFRAGRSRQALLSALQKIPDAAFSTEPPGEWGAARILRHVVFVEYYWTLALRELVAAPEGRLELGQVHRRVALEASRLAGTALGEPAPFPSRREALRALDASRGGLVAAVKGLRSGDFARTISDPRIGSMPLRFAIEHVIEHDWDHAVQLAGLRV
jgi:uncharacterized damage-inducible protein DinB